MRCCACRILPFWCRWRLICWHGTTASARRIPIATGPSISYCSVASNTRAIWGASHVERYLSWLAVERGVSPGTQALALNALVFVKKVFLGQPLDLPQGFLRATRQRKLPVVLTVAEVARFMAQLEGLQYLMGGLLYGSGCGVLSWCDCVSRMLTWTTNNCACSSGRAVNIA